MIPEKWNIKTSISSYINTFKDKMMYAKKGDKIKFVTNPKNTIFNYKINGSNSETFEINKNKISKNSQLVKIWVFLGLIEPEFGAMVKAGNIFDINFVMNFSFDDDRMEDFIVNKLLCMEDEERMIEKYDDAKYSFYFAIVANNLLKAYKNCNKKNFDGLYAEEDINEAFSICLKNLNWFYNEAYYFYDNKFASKEIHEVANCWYIDGVCENIFLFDKAYKYVFKNNYQKYIFIDDSEKELQQTNFNSDFEPQLINYQIEENTIPKITSRNMSFGNFLITFIARYGANHISVPLYQRDYTWESELINGLFVDILSIENSDEHYIGNIVLKDNQDEFRIVDGQQRITSMLIILRCIYNCFITKKIPIPNILHELFSISNPEKTSLVSSRFTRVEHNNDMKIFKEFMNGFPLIDTKSNIYKNAVSVTKRVRTLNEKELFQCFENYMNKISIVVTVDKISNEYELFENLNTKSQNLTTMELIKNYMLQQMDDKFVEKNAGFLYKLFNDNVTNKFKVYDKKQDSLMKEFITVFLRYHQKTYKNSKQFQEFKSVLSVKYFSGVSKISDHHTATKIFEDLGTKISEFLNLYIEKNYFNKKSSVYYVSDLLTMVNGRSVYTPLIMKIFDYYGFYQECEKDITSENNLSDDVIQKVRECLFEIEKYEVKFQVTIYRGQSLSNKIDLITENIEKVGFTPENVKEAFKNVGGNFDVSDDVFVSELKTKKISDKISRLIGYRIDINLRNDGKLYNGKHNFTELYFSEKTVEHIMPQSLTNEWIDKLRLKLQTTSEMIMSKHKSYCGLIGNLMTIEKNSNSSLSNNLFDEKIKIYNDQTKIKESCQYKGHDGEIKLTSLTAYSEWDFDAINKRSEEIAELAFDIWCN